MARDKEPADREAGKLEGIEGIEGVELVYISARCNLPRIGILGAEVFCVSPARSPACRMF